VISILSLNTVVLQNKSSEKNKKVYLIIIIIKSVNISSEILNFERNIHHIIISLCEQI
jgi:hypothetical protein